MNELLTVEAWKALSDQMLAYSNGTSTVNRRHAPATSRLLKKSLSHPPNPHTRRTFASGVLTSKASST